MSTLPDASHREWWSRPSTVLPLVGSVALLVALFTPQSTTGRSGDSRLSSHISGSLGGRVLYEMARRYGWATVRRDSIPAPINGHGTVVHAVLAPTIPLSRENAHQYLEAVRSGDALLMALNERSPLSDSLGVTHQARGGILPAPAQARSACMRHRELPPPLWADGRVHLFGVRWLRAAPPASVVFATLDRDERGTLHPGEAAVGFSLGRGRVVVVGDPDLLRNDVLRHCAWGTDVIAMRMLEWLRAGGAQPRTTLVFDEFHQGFGSHPAVFGVAFTFLVAHPVGRMILTVVVATLVLLIARAPRAIVPAPPVRVERRDPLEQVDALAHAYEQVHASRTVATRLLRGVRWRVERGGTSLRLGGDDAFLDAAMTRSTALTNDVSLIRRALRETIPDRELPDLGAALRRVEQSFTTPSA